MTWTTFLSNHSGPIISNFVWQTFSSQILWFTKNRVKLYLFFWHTVYSARLKCQFPDFGPNIQGDRWKYHKNEYNLEILSLLDNAVLRISGLNLETPLFVAVFLPEHYVDRFAQFSNVMNLIHVLHVYKIIYVFYEYLLILNN